MPTDIERFKGWIYYGDGSWGKVSLPITTISGIIRQRIRTYWRYLVPNVRYISACCHQRSPGVIINGRPWVSWLRFKLTGRSGPYVQPTDCIQCLIADQRFQPGIGQYDCKT